MLALLLALAHRSPRLFLLVLVADGAAEGLADGLKAAVGEQRPDVQRLMPLPHSHAFPSGHTTTSFACATILGALVPRAAPAVFVLAAAIGYSRVYVGVHWPLDVVGGAALGVLTALLLLAAARRRSGGRLRRG